MPLVKRSDDKTRGDEHNEKTVDDAVAAQQERMAKIVEAIDDLEDADFTGSGKPEIPPLEEITGFDDITAKERDEAWKEYNEEA